MESKEAGILELFFNNPTKEWHFEEILKTAKIARSKADRWLKKFTRQQLVKRVSEKGKMPYYIGNYESSSYKMRKKVFALNQLYESGLLTHLDSLKKVRTVIIFGSFARSDWYENSDVDVFIYGNPEGLSIAKYELKLHRNIQLFVCPDKKELKRFGDGLIKSIVKGNVIKGDIDFAIKEFEKTK